MTSFARMLHPTDFSESSAPALAMAIDMARRQGAELHLLHVSPTFGEDPLHSAYLAALDERRFYKHLQDEADARMVALIERMGAGDLRIKRVHTHGPSTAPMILSYAAEEQVELPFPVARLLLRRATQQSGEVKTHSVPQLAPGAA